MKLTYNQKIINEFTHNKMNLIKNKFNNIYNKFNNKKRILFNNKFILNILLKISKLL